MINNPKMVRIVAVVVIAMLVITLAATLFGCSAKADAEGNDPHSGLAWVSPDRLPAEARETLDLIEAGGPYPFQRDGVVFGNREKLLPKEASGYYHEYTVKTPGEDDRGARRIVTGKNAEYYYTDDHYRSFRRIRVQP